MYLKKSVLAKEYDISVGSVNSRIRLIREKIPSRYPAGSVIATGRIIRVRDDVFEDAMIYGDAILCGVAPEFRPHERHAWEDAG